MIKSSLKEQLYLRNRFRSGYEVWLQMPRHFQAGPEFRTASLDVCRTTSKRYCQVNGLSPL